MSQYRFSLSKAVSRGKGQSAVAKAAYNGREQLHDDRHGKSTRDYGRPTKNSGGKDDVLFSGIFLDTTRDVPKWATDREKMWNAASTAEKRKDAREAQEIIVNLPWELTQKQREYMLTDFCREITRSTGRIADVNMHKAPKHGDDRNIHAHILLTVREIRPDGFTGKRFEIIPEQIEQWKQKWAARGARELKKAGFALEAERWAVGHLTKEKQRDAALKRLDLEHAATLMGAATKHLGPEAAAMERKGKGSDRSDIRREEVVASKELAKLKREMAAIDKQISIALYGRIDPYDRHISDVKKDQARGLESRAVRKSLHQRGELHPEKQLAPTQDSLTKDAKLAEAVRSVLRPPKPSVPSKEAGKDVPQKPPDRDRER
jgi:hypothetical protein